MTKSRRKRDPNDAPADETVAAPQAPAPPPQRRPLVSEREWNRVTIVVVALILIGGTWRNYWQNGNAEQYHLLLLGRTLFQGGALYTQVQYDGLPGPAWASAGAYVLAPACDDACTQRLGHLLHRYTKTAETRDSSVFIHLTERSELKDGN